MPYSEEEIKKYLNILQSYKDTFNNTSLIFKDTIPLKTPEKFLVIIVAILILSNIMVLVIVINVSIQLAIFLVIMK